MRDSEKEVLKSHSIKFLEAAFRADRLEKIRHADGHGKKTGDCGDTIEFFLRLKGDRIDILSYAMDGCLNTNACANAIIDLVEGRSTTQAWELTPEDVATYLESLPQDHFHCAELTTGALYLALSDARDKQKSPWKKMYR